MSNLNIKSVLGTVLEYCTYGIVLGALVFVCVQSAEAKDDIEIPAEIPELQAEEIGGLTSALFTVCSSSASMVGRSQDAIKSKCDARVSKQILKLVEKRKTAIKMQACMAAIKEGV
jgi:hypothetical protein